MKVQAFKHIVPRSLAGQMITLLLITLVVAQGVSIFVFAGEREAALVRANNFQMVTRIATTYRLLRDVSTEQHAQVILAANSSDLRLWKSEESAVDPSNSGNSPFRRALEDGIIATGARQVLVDVSGGLAFQGRSPRPGPQVGRPDPRRPRGGFRPRQDLPPLPPLDRVELAISIQFDDGSWLNAATRHDEPVSGWATASLVSMALTAIALIAMVIFMVRRITRPMRTLAIATEGVGRGEEIADLPEKGPEDIRRVTRAFNRMQERLERFVRDRTQMLAAISHDLRSPITVLRLRAEMIEDVEIREKMLGTLQEMSEMTEATLTFARQEADHEQTRTVDLSALIGAVCDDIAESHGELSHCETSLGEMGGKQVVTFEPQDGLAVRGRSVSLKRAMRNLIENAIAYGTCARVRLRIADRIVTIFVDDDGPGIDQASREDVFAPFYRLEGSRNRDTGGVGLGLSIARTIIRSHGGDIELENRDSASGAVAGLRVTITLPTLL